MTYGEIFALAFLLPIGIGLGLLVVVIAMILLSLLSEKTGLDDYLFDRMDERRTRRKGKKKEDQSE